LPTTGHFIGVLRKENHAAVGCWPMIHSLVLHELTFSAEGNLGGARRYNCSVTCSTWRFYERVVLGGSCRITPNSCPVAGLDDRGVRAIIVTGETYFTAHVGCWMLDAARCWRILRRATVCAAGHGDTSSKFTSTARRFCVSNGGRARWRNTWGLAFSTSRRGPLRVVYRRFRVASRRATSPGSIVDNAGTGRETSVMA